MVVLDRFFFLWESKKWSLVALVRSSYTVTIVWESAWVDSALAVLDEWSSYRGGRFNRFDFTWKLIYKRLILSSQFTWPMTLFMANRSLLVAFLWRVLICSLGTGIGWILAVYACLSKWKNRHFALKSCQRKWMTSDFLI